MTTFAELVARGSLIVSDGYRTKLAELGPQGYPILRVAEIGNGTVTPSFGDHVRSEYRDNIGYKLSLAGDVLLTTKGTVGRRAIMPALPSEFAYSPQLCFFRTLDDSIDNRWLYYWLGGPEFWQQAASVAQQTDMAPYISLRDLRAIEIELPPVAEQRGIAATLGALDDKIESNRRATRLIESLLLATFQGLLANNEVQQVPLATVATCTKGVSYKSTELAPSATSLVTLKSIDRNGGYKSVGLKQYAGPYKPEQVLIPGDVVVAQTDLTQGAEVVGRAVRVPPEDSADILVASLDLVIVRPNPDIPAAYLLGVLTDERFRDHCRARTSGTTVLHLASDAIPTYPAPLVSKEMRMAFAATVGPLIEHADSMAAETRLLAALRDTLLPELLSGRIRVPEAREAVAEAAGSV